MASRQYLTQLRNHLTKYFNEDELRLLSFDLGKVYEDLPGNSRPVKAMELVNWLQRNGRLPDLVAMAGQLRPSVDWTNQTPDGARIFIGYKRAAAVDNRLAQYLQNTLSTHGHQVFIDKSMRAGTSWLEEIDQQLKTADFLLVLLSPESVRSEMVKAEVHRAYDTRQQQGNPQILPVRVQYEGLMPYAIAAFTNPTQYVDWSDESDNIRVSRAILAAIEGGLPQQPPLDGQGNTPPQILSEDGLPVLDSDQHQAPLPEFDPRFVETLLVPGGTVRLSDTFYIVREADARLRREILRPGSITTIRAPRQTGKSSLLVRGIQHALQHEATVVNLDLQRVGQDEMAGADVFLLYFTNFIARRLRIDAEKVEAAWKEPVGAQDRLTFFLEDHVLANVEQPLVLAMDEVDRLLETDFHTDFFGMVRSWHNNAAYDALWERLRLVMVISTEPYLLIRDITQSPFNVGLKLYLEDFTDEQVADLNRRYQNPVREEELSHFMALLGGQPYLVRKALYTMVTEEISWPDLARVAATPEGPFGDHLRHQHWMLRDKPSLSAALQQILRGERCDDEDARFRLLRAGLIRASGDACSARCDLYLHYFSDVL